MRSSIKWSLLSLACAMTVNCIAANDVNIRSVSMTNQAKLLLNLRSGGRIYAPSLPDQVGFEQPAVARGGNIVGWLADFRDAGAPDPLGAAPLPAALVLFSRGRIVRIFHTDQVFWSWNFAKRGRAVVFCAGPTHGGASSCELHNLVQD